MPWNPEREPTDERADFVEAVLRRHAPFAQICQHFDIRLETGYKWLTRATSARPQPLRGGGCCGTARARCDGCRWTGWPRGGP